MISNVATMLNTFWNSFGIPAYVEDHVPDEASLPYITYTQSIPDWNSSVTMQARVWYKGDSFTSLNSKVDEISNTIGLGFSMHDNSNIVIIHRDDNFYQIQPFLDDSKIRVAYLNMIINVT